MVHNQIEAYICYGKQEGFKTGTNILLTTFVLCFLIKANLLTSSILKHFLLIILLFNYCSLASQVDDFPIGEIVDSIAVSKTSNETFALYLPSNHKPNTLSPIVFIFDPAARGKIGIHPFIKAAEKYNYILICSNNSKNGPYDQNIKIASRLYDKVFSDFSINPKRVYTAGFSGGEPV